MSSERSYRRNRHPAAFRSIFVVIVLLVISDYISTTQFYRAVIYTN